MTMGTNKRLTKSKKVRLALALGAEGAPPLEGGGSEGEALVLASSAWAAAPLSRSALP